MRMVSIAAVLMAIGSVAWGGTFSGLPVVNDRTVAPQDKFTFAILGDKTSGGEGKWPIYDRAVDAINLLDPDFVITVGDQIPGHMTEREKWDQEWAEYLEHARRLEMPLILAPGNHDIANTESYQFWKEDWGSTYYSFDYRGCHFLVLNTEEERFDGRGPVWEAMMAFAEKDLAEHADSRHTFLFFHKPMWDDPRFQGDWARLERALGTRKYTAVAGHEHYLMAERRNGNLLVVQSATGGGIHLSDVKEFGSFHSFGIVTVDGDEVTYAVVEPEGGVWPVDVAPTWFRKAIVREVVRLDADVPEDLSAPTATVRAKALLENVLKKPVVVEVTVKPVGDGWELAESVDGAHMSDGVLVLTAALEPGERAERALTYRVEQKGLSRPPVVSWRVQYDGGWIPNESFPMEQENVVPIYPQVSLRAVEEWAMVGPFRLGPIDTSRLPGDPGAANARLLERIGPEDGYDPARVYEDGLRWRPVESVGRGLLNMNALAGTVDQAVAYALCGVRSPEDQLVHAVVYADNYAQVVLNGELIEEAQGFAGGFTYVPLRLKAGWNTFIVKVINNKADWFGRVLIADPKGNLEFRRTPE